MILLFLKNASLITIQALAACGFGLSILKGLGLNVKSDPEDGLLYSLGLGYGAMALASFFLGLEGLFSVLPTFLFWVCGLGLLIFYLRFSNSPLQTVERESGFWKAFLEPWPFFVLFVVSILGNLIFSHSPPLRDDSTYIYLVFPQIYARMGRLVPIPENPHAYFPQAVEMLYTQLMIFSSAEAAKLLNWFFGVLGALTLTRIAWKHLKARRIALITAIYYTMPWVASLSGTGKIDLGSLLWALLAFHAWLSWDGEKDGALFLSAILAGMHLASKYTGAAVVAVLLVSSAARLARREFVNILKTLFVLGAISTLFILPWCLRNIFLKGNPIYPANFLGHSGDFYLYAFYRMGKPASWSAYFTHTWNEVIYGTLIDGTGPLLCAVLPYVIWEGWRSKQGSLLRITAMGLASVILCAAAIPGIPPTRFLAPGLSLLSMATAVYLDRKWDRVPSALKTALWATLLFPGVLFSLAMGAKRIPLWTGGESSNEFIKKNWSLIEDYDLYRFITERIPQGQNILFTYQNVAPAFFYPNQHAFGIGIYSPEFYSLGIDEAASQLRRDGIRYVLTSQVECRYNFVGDCISPLGVKLSWIISKQMAKRFQLLFQGSRSSLYELKD
jgi:hypothetical protein